MSDYTKDQIVSALFSALPYPQHVYAVDTESTPEAVRIHWRGDYFRISLNGMVEQSIDGLLHGNNAAILLEALVKWRLVELMMKK